MIREVALADGEEALDGGLQLVVYPDAAHGVVAGGEDHHRCLVGIVVRDHLVHIEQVAVAVANHVGTQAFDGILEVEVYGVAGTYAVAGVAALLGGTRCDVAGAEVTEGRVAALQIEVAVVVGDVGRAFLAGADSLGVLFLLRHPDAAVVAQRLAHQSQLALVLAVHGDTGGVNLSESQVGQICALLEGLHCSRAVAAHGVGAQEESTTVTAGSKYHSVSGVALQFARDQVAHDHTACAAVHQHDVKHLAAVEALHCALLDLTVERRISAQQQLLTGLTLGIECTAHLSAAERAVGQQAAVFACERHTLCHALVDDIARHLGKAVYVGLARAEVTALYSVVEQAVHRVAVVLIVLGCVDTALGCDRVSAARTVLDAEVQHIEAQLAQGRGCRCTCQTRTYHDDVEVALVGRVYQLLVCLIVGPLLS